MTNWPTSPVSEFEFICFDHSPADDSSVREGVETLCIEARRYVVMPFDEDLCFRNLRRLAIQGLPAPWTQRECERALFTPRHMPNLRHLALECKSVSGGTLAEYAEDDYERIDDSMGSLDDQIITLALYICDDCGTRPARPLPQIDYYSNLRHLACLDLGRLDNLEPLAMLFPDGVQAELESLHLQSSDLFRSELFWLDDVRKGRKPGLVIKRIVLYGGEEWRARLQRYCPDFELDQYAWRDKSDPDWEDFDGR